MISIIPEKYLAKYAKSNEFIISNKKFGEELRFTRAQDVNDKKFIELLGDSSFLSSQIINAELPRLSTTYTMRELQKAAPNGLFTSQIDPKMLSHFHSDDSYSTMVRNRNVITGHSGFKKVNCPAINNPVRWIAFTMSAMSMICGQYYFQLINGNLNSLHEEITLIKNKLDNEKKGKLIYAAHRFYQISKMKHIDDSELREIQRIKRISNEIYWEYRSTCEELYDELMHLELRELTVGKRMAHFNQKVENYSENFNILIEADKVRTIAAVLEIVLRQRKDSHDVKLEDLYNNLYDEVNDDFCRMVQQKKEIFFDPIMNSARNIIESGISGLIMEEEYMSVTQKCISRMRDLVASSGVEMIYSQLLSERELVLMPDIKARKQRVFLSVVEESN